MHTIGWGRYRREAYPQADRGAAAFQDRLIAPFQTLAGFTPATNPSASLIGAALVTPKASGIFMLIGHVVLSNGAGADTYGVVASAATGPSLSVGGGSVTIGGWTFGTTAPPTIGGGPAVLQPTPIGLADVTLPANALGSIPFSGMNATALAVGVPAVIEILLTEVGGEHALSSVGVQASIVELP